MEYSKLNCISYVWLAKYGQTKITNKIDKLKIFSIKHTIHNACNFMYVFTFLKRQSQFSMFIFDFSIEYVLFVGYD